MPRSACEDARRYRRFMWQSPVLSSERRGWEKRANAAAKACRQERKGKGGGGKKPARGLFRPGYSPEQLWTLPIRKRKIDASGLLSPEDTIVAIARGMHPGIHRKAEEKAMRDGGLLVLRKAGLPVPKDTSFEGVRKAVATRGSALKRAAWGARGVLILGSTGMKVSTAIHSAVPAIASLFGPIGMLVAAAAGGHVAITQSIARKVLAEQEGYLKDGLRRYGGKASRGVDPPTPEEKGAMREAEEVPRSWIWIGLGVAGVVVAAVAASGREAA